MSGKYLTGLFKPAERFYGTPQLQAAYGVHAGGGFIQEGETRAGEQTESAHEFAFVAARQILCLDVALLLQTQTANDPVSLFLELIGLHAFNE